MATKIESIKEEFSPHVAEAAVTVDQAIPGNLGHAAHKFHFLRHLLEMTIAMMIGMAVGGALFRSILAPMGMTFRETRLQFPELCLLVMAFNMSVPMVAWMRHRGHGWRTSSEMAAAMFVPAIGAIGLLSLHLVTSRQAFVLEHALMLPAMVVVMLFRRSEYTGTDLAPTTI